MNEFRLSDELEAFRSEMRKSFERAFREKAAYWDEHEEFPHENRAKLVELGVCGLRIPEEFGGMGMPLINSVLCVEEIARICPTTSLIAQLYLHSVGGHIASRGTPEMKKRLLPGLARGEHFFSIAITEPHAGSSATDMRTSARIEGDQVVINGSKCYISGTDILTHVLVFVRFGDSKGANGIGAVIVERGTPGFEIGKAMKKMGFKGYNDADLYFDNCRVPVENIFVLGEPENSNGFKKLMSSFGTERLGNAAMCIGIAQGAFDFAKEYTEKREQFGRPICEFQGLQWKMADMAVQIHARLMTYRAAFNVNERGIPDPHETAMAKLYGAEMVQRVTSEAIQLCGHFGYTREAPLERMYRDSRGFAIFGGSAEMLRNLIASNIYGRSFSQRRS
jgi:alkylation response protein AidB-like acyl-CoA dehydrogenase